MQENEEDIHAKINETKLGRDSMEVGVLVEEVVEVTAVDLHERDLDDDLREGKTLCVAAEHHTEHSMFEQDIMVFRRIEFSRDKRGDEVIESRDVPL